MNSSDSTQCKTCLLYDTRRTSSLSIKPVVEDQLRECPQAILWCNAGLYGLILKERVTNAVVLRNEKRGAGIAPTPLVFYWHEATEITPSAAKALIGSSSGTMKTQ